MIKRVFLISFLGIFLFASLGWAQESTGDLEGRVLDPEGNAMASVDIQISGPSLQGVRRTRTDAQGYFRTLLLPVGEYSVKLSSAAFAEVTFEKVSIRLGTTTTLGEIHLEKRVAEEFEITVTAEKPIIDPVSTTLGTTLEFTTYESLPLHRNYRSIISLIPQANTSYYGDEVNISGSQGQENAYFIDGINVTEPVYARMNTNLPYNFVKEIEVKTGGYEAEFGRAMGGIVNVITQTGGNDFRGQLFGFFTNHNFAGNFREGAVQQKIDNFSDSDFGLSLGGPIVHDKLWFFLAYSPNFEDKKIEIPGLGLHNDQKRSHLFAGKLTWQAAPNTNFEFTILGDPSKHKKIASTFADIIPVPNTVLNADPYLGDIREGGYNLSLHGRHIVNEKLFLEASISQYKRSAHDGPLTGRGSTDPFFYDLLSGTISGGYGRVIKGYATRKSAQASGSLFLGRHNLKAGFSFEDNFVDGTFDNMAGEDGLTPSLIFLIAPSVYWTTWSAKSATVHNRILSFFAQDSWLVSRRLKLNAGLRWDGQFFIGGDGKIAQRITDQWQPRIGFIYQLGELGSQKIFGSYGRFYEQIPLSISWGFHAPQNYHEILYFHDPRLDHQGGLDNDLSSGIIPEVKGLKGQHFDEFTLGYERRVGDKFKIGVRGIYRNLLQVVDDGFDPVTMNYTMGNPGEGNLSFLPKFKRQYVGLELTLEKRSGKLTYFASYVLSRNYGNYPGIIDTDAGWTYPNANFSDFLEQWINSTGLLPNDRTHVFKLFGSYFFKFGLSIGTNVFLQSGTPLNEFGTFSVPGRIIFLKERGTAGRTPTIWDLNIRLKYDLGKLTGTGFRPKFIVDLFHLFSRQKAVIFDQLHYLGVDALGNQVALNPNYLSPSLYQPPWMLRFGFELDF
ncbi:MAG: TonB-dependent receptor [Candidatus Aminicenantes bacterium]|nr:TonB-dependent receptor [Candidatus Aminicenantes bacterium]